MHANRPLLANALRSRFGFADGFIGSDNTNVEGLSNYMHGFASNSSDAARLAIAAGVDQDMPGGAYLSLAPMVASGFVPMAHVDRAAGNVLRKKFASRLFDDEPDPSLAKHIDSQEARSLARHAAEQGSVLLINRAQTLPLNTSHQRPLRRVALVGPFATDGVHTTQAFMGGYSPGAPAGGVVTIGAALRKREVQVDVAVGCGAGVGGPSATDADFAKAVALAGATSTDAVIAVLGSTSCGCCVRCGNGEAGDRMSLEPEGRQLELLAALINASHAQAARSGKVAAPVVAVLIHGRPLSFEGGGATSAGLARRREAELVAADSLVRPPGWEEAESYNGGSRTPWMSGSDGVLDGLDALLAAWRPGEEGGTAIANLLLGDANPSGKLAQAWQRSAGYSEHPHIPNCTPPSPLLSLPPDHESRLNPPPRSNPAPPVQSPTSPWFQVHSSMTSGRYFGNGDGTPLLPLFPFAHGLSFTTFNFTGLLTALPAGLPPTASGKALRSLAVNVSLAVTNTGTRSGATPVIVTYARSTRGVVRYARETCAFAKVHLMPGQMKRVSVQVRLSDLARWDPTADPPTEDGGEGALPPRTIASGAWVVDGGAYTFFAAGCVANAILRDIHHAGDPTCPFYESAVVGKSVNFGQEGQLYGVYM